MTAYYNEIDKKAAAWLRELITDGLIAPGDVDERSITNVEPADLSGYTQCHFFAGVGGWSIAARLAGWPDDREIWSASCPCQPFSVAGKGTGAADARHLWPDFFRLTRARRPAFIVGEQVAAAVGKDWFVGVRSDLESIGYVGRGVVVPACAVNAPHRRDRLWFVAGSRLLGDANHARSQGHARHVSHETRRPQSLRSVAATGRSDCGRLEHAESVGWGEGRPESELRRGWDAASSAGVSLSDVANGYGGGRCARLDHAPARHGHSIAAASGAGAWDSARWLIGHDGKARRVEPGLGLLVNGVPDCLESVLSIEAEATKRVTTYAKTTQTRTNQVLRALWEFARTQDIRESPGRLRGIPEKAVLLGFLCCLHSALHQGPADDSRGGHPATIRRSGAQTLNEIRGHVMRRVRRYRISLARTSHRRQPEERRIREPSDALLQLSCEVAQAASAHWIACLSAHAADNRTGLLRGYGNAIVPQLAAEVIGAWMDVETFA